MKGILIVGAGDAGRIVVKELSKGSDKTEIVGFADDDVSKQGQLIEGFPVLGTIDDIPRIVESEGVEEVLIAIPSASGEINHRIYQICNKTSVRVRQLPSIAMAIYDVKPMLPLMRKFSVEDLLRRAPVRTDMTLAKGYIAGRRVLITGGGGSIGSELARQTAPLGPSSLVLLGKGENSVFEIDRELRDTEAYPSQPIVCDVRDVQSLDAVFTRFTPNVVFHAAAHKHVPLMEDVPIEAVRNNVFGTLNAVEACIKHGVDNFILVSTDKAVNPSNVMGATKRVAELIVQAAARRTDANFSIVRFGNVLGSRGSLVPILRRQIDQGGPLTITHPDMTRFFMTIPEAAQLIVQAGSFGRNGEVFILDMGKPVKIVDLAIELLKMHNLTPGEDIEIRYTGIRPGEKMHEELVHEFENLEPLLGGLMRKASTENRVDWNALKQALQHLENLCNEGDQSAVRTYLLELALETAVPPLALEP